MTENKKAMRILAGVFLLVQFVLAAASAVFSYLNLSSHLPANQLGSVLLSSLPSYLGGVAILLTAVFVLARKFKAAGVVQILVAVMTAAQLAAGVISRLQMQAFSMLNIVGTSLGSALTLIATVLFAIALFAQHKPGQGLCVTSAILALIASIVSQVFVFVGAGYDMRSMLTAMIMSLVTTLALSLFGFLARIFLGSYFGSMPDKRPRAWIDQMIYDREHPAQSVSF